MQWHNIKNKDILSISPVKIFFISLFLLIVLLLLVPLGTNASSSCGATCWIDSDCQAAYLHPTGNTCCWGVDYCALGMTCFYNHIDAIIPCPSYCIGGTTWKYGGIARCTSTGWTCDYQTETCLSCGTCCDNTCIDASGCVLSQNDSNCSPYCAAGNVRKYNGYCESDCRCSYPSSQDCDNNDYCSAVYECRRFDYECRSGSCLSQDSSCNPSCPYLVDNSCDNMCPSTQTSCPTHVNGVCDGDQTTYSCVSGSCSGSTSDYDQACDNLTCDDTETSCPTHTDLGCDGNKRTYKCDALGNCNGSNSDYDQACDGVTCDTTQYFCNTSTCQGTKKIWQCDASGGCTGSNSDYDQECDGVTCGTTDYYCDTSSGGVCDGHKTTYECDASGNCNGLDSDNDSACDNLTCDTTDYYCDTSSGGVCDGHKRTYKCDGLGNCNGSNSDNDSDCNNLTCDTTDYYCDTHSGGVCDGHKTTYKCDGSGSCDGTNSDNDSDCNGESCGTKSNPSCPEKTCIRYCDGSGNCGDCTPPPCCNDDTDCPECYTCSGGTCVSQGSVADGNKCNDDCTECSSGSCVNRPAGATTECGTCDACDVAGGNCVGITEADGKNCDGDCTQCSSGSCVDRLKCDSTECSGQDRCNAAGGDCRSPDNSSVICSDCYSATWDSVTNECCGDDGVNDDWCNSGDGSCVNGGWYNDHCSDGIQNCDEEAINCGGSYCISCYTLSVNLLANPNSGTAPLNDVDLEALVSGTMPGTINYKFDCTSDGTWELEVNNTGTNPYTASNLCNYPTAGNYTAKVFIERGTGSREDTVDVLVTPNSAPNVSMSCDASNCTGGSCADPWISYRPTAEPTPCVFTIVNNSSDPDPEDTVTSVLYFNDVEKSRSTNYANYTIPNAIVKGNYEVKLCVNDGVNPEECVPHNLDLREEVWAEFMCSLDNENWESCETISLAEDERLYLKDNIVLSEHSVYSEGANSISSRVWQVGDGENFDVPFATDDDNPSITLTLDEKVIRLIVTDNQGRIDYQDHTISVTIPFPEWEEIAPF